MVCKEELSSCRPAASQEYSSLAQLSSWQRIEVTFAFTDPFRVDQLLTHGIHKLVGGTNSSVADACCLGYLLGGFRLAHKMRRSVDARCCDGQRRPTGERANLVSLFRDTLGDDSDAEIEP